ncbi:peroxiredoxin, partial [Thermus sp.]|uniref:peroxiredoxin n=1 Tax=Thermus sp. TaxID=275 RepID=UPI00263454EB
MPAAGKPAPDFTLPDQQGQPRRLHAWRGKWLVLYFYPKDDTPGCTEQACTLRDEWLQLQALGAEVVGVSVDSSASHAAFAHK